jgi:hypothetical protein
MDLAPVLALRVPKPECVATGSSDQPPAHHAPAEIPCGNAIAALHELEARPLTDNARVGCATYEHCESVEAYHEISMVGRTLEFSCTAARLEPGCR